MKTLTPYLFLGSLFLLATCTKFGKNISITGYARNPVTGEPYEGLFIRLLRTDGGIPGGLKSVANVTTNADGYFEIHHYGAYNHYELGAYPESDMFIVGWFEDGEHVGAGRMNVEKGRYMHPIFEMVPYGKLITNIQNVNCEGASDQMQFRSKTQFDEDFGAWSSIRDGCYSYTSTEPNEVITGYRYYELKVTRSGGTTYQNYSVFIPSSGVAQIDLLY